MMLEKRQKERTEVPITPVESWNKSRTLGLRALWGCISSAQNIQSKPVPRHLTASTMGLQHPKPPSSSRPVHFPDVASRLQSQSPGRLTGAAASYIKDAFAWREKCRSFF